jgi:hypothetical protein
MPKKSTSRHIMVKLLKAKKKEKNLKSNKRKFIHELQGNTSKINVRKNSGGHKNSRITYLKCTKERGDQPYIQQSYLSKMKANKVSPR